MVVLCCCVTEVVAVLINYLLQEKESCVISIGLPKGPSETL